jgi:hypothetical protein
MTIAEKLTRAKADLDAAYLTDTYYLPGSLNFRLMFYKTAFPVGYNLTLNIATAPASLAEVFRVVTGLEKLTIKVPTDTAYPADYFALGPSSGNSTLKELTFPDGIKFSSFINFCNQCVRLQKVNGRIDLSSSTSNAACFDNCPELVDVRFMPGTITKSLTFNKSSNLSDESIRSIVSGLADLTGQTTQTLTVHATVKSRIVALGLEGVITDDKNWTLVS